MRLVQERARASGMVRSVVVNYVKPLHQHHSKSCSNQARPPPSPIKNSDEVLKLDHCLQKRSHCELTGSTIIIIVTNSLTKKAY